MVTQPTDTRREAVDRLCNDVHESKAGRDVRVAVQSALLTLLARAEAAEAERDALQAENARLREAMEYIMDGYGLNAPEFKQEEKDENGEPVADDWIVSCIRAALEAKP